MEEENLEVAYNCEKYNKFEIDNRIRFYLQIVNEIIENREETISNIWKKLKQLRKK